MWVITRIRTPVFWMVKVPPHPEWSADRYDGKGHCKSPFINTTHDRFSGYERKRWANLPLCRRHFLKSDSSHAAKMPLPASCTVSFFTISFLTSTVSLSLFPI